MISVAPIRQALPDGSVATIPATWAEYEEYARSRGDRSIPRFKYANGLLHLKMPTFEHGQLDAIVADLIVWILNQQLRDYTRTTPVTLKVPKQAGIEPDHCFWIEHWRAVNGKKRIDLATDPPPDIVIEVDVTNFTQVDDYQPFKVPEVWLIRADRLEIFSLAPNRYVLTDTSRFFPDIAVQQVYGSILGAIAEGASLPRAIRQATPDYLNDGQRD
ncbi:MAG: Uma2 family endonuclease [Pseudanabaenales cyanobacterium]|nr:Uma2 family endonuclease [Pseudanabaenales cyanobacterium]